MRKILTILFVALSIASFSQAPEGINYQAVIRESDGSVLAEQAVGLHVAIIQGTPSGVPVYEESFSATTSQFGSINIVIGEGTMISGDFSSINWSAGSYFVKISADATGGTDYTSLGTQQLMSVPYSLYAKTAENVTNDQVDDADADPTNELQTWSTLPDIPGELTDGDDTEDADADPTNELQSWTTLPGIPAELTDGDDVDDADSDPSNEIELPATANEGDILLYTGGQWQSGSPGGEVFQYSSNYLTPSNTERNTWVDYTDVSITVSETGTYYLEYYGFGQNTNMYNSSNTTMPDGDMHMRVQNTTTDQTILDVTATETYIDVTTSSTVWRYINQYPSGWRVADLSAGDVIKIQYIQYTADDTLEEYWQMGASGISIRKIN